MTGDAPSPAQLRSIPDPFVRQLASLGRVRTYPKNTVFITEGDSSDSVFVILSGRIKVFLSDTEGHEMILDMQGKKQEAGAISSKMSDADQMALMQGAANIFGKCVGAR